MRHTADETPTLPEPRRSASLTSLYLWRAKAEHNITLRTTFHFRPACSFSKLIALSRENAISRERSALALASHFTNQVLMNLRMMLLEAVRADSMAELCLGAS